MATSQCHKTSLGTHVEDLRHYGILDNKILPYNAKYWTGKVGSGFLDLDHCLCAWLKKNIGHLVLLFIFENNRTFVLNIILFPHLKYYILNELNTSTKQLIDLYQNLLISELLAGTSHAIGLILKRHQKVGVSIGPWLRHIAVCKEVHVSPDDILCLKWQSRMSEVKS